MSNIDQMMGLTFTSVEKVGDDLLEFRGERCFRFYHDQNCCENVRIEDIVGDLSDLVGSPLTMADEVSNVDDSGNYESATWTYYKFATIKGYVTVRWLGESNGYYSESVDYCEFKP